MCRGKQRYRYLTQENLSASYLSYLRHFLPHRNRQGEEDYRANEALLDALIGTALQSSGQGEHRGSIRSALALYVSNYLPD